MSRRSLPPAIPHPGDDQVFGPREQRAIWLLLGSAFTVMLNETIMGVALPRLMEDLDITAASGQWLTTAFLLTMSVVIPITGMLIQRYPTRRLFLTAMSLFTAGTLIAALAPGFSLLLLGRVVQAGGTAIMMPLLMTTVTTLVPPRHRGRIMGRIAVVMAVSPALGPTVSGMILQWFGWRWLFLFVLPIAITALLAGALRLPNLGVPRVARVDALSVLLSAVGFGGIVFALSVAGERASGTESTHPLLPTVLGVISLAWFVWRQRSLEREDRALLDLRTLNVRPYALSVILFAFFSLALFGSLILIPIYMQHALGYATIDSGLTLLPGALLMGLLGPLVGRLVDQRGARFILVPGTVLTALAMWSMSLFTTSSTAWQILATHIVLSLGLAGVFTPLFSVSLGSLPSRLAAHGSALISTVQQLAGAAGTALFVTVMTVVATRTAGAPDAVDAEALVTGARLAFMFGGVAATVGAVFACFITETRRSYNV